VELAITTQRADDRGWIAFAPEVRATAQGLTEEEAKNNLRALFARYPDLLEEPRQAADRSGKKVAVHCHPSQSFWPQALSRLIPRPRDLAGPSSGVGPSTDGKRANAGAQARAIIAV